MIECKYKKVFQPNYWFYIFHKDDCASVTCLIPDETCQEGKCKCGAGQSCQENADMPVCDAVNGVCVRGI